MVSVYATLANMQLTELAVPTACLKDVGNALVAQFV